VTGRYFGRALIAKRVRDKKPFSVGIDQTGRKQSGQLE